MYEYSNEYECILSKIKKKHFKITFNDDQSIFHAHDIRKRVKMSIFFYYNIENQKVQRFAPMSFWNT